MCIGGKRTTRQVISEVEIKTFATKAVIAAIPDGPAQDACHVSQAARRAQPAWEGITVNRISRFSHWRPMIRKAFLLLVIVLQAKLDGYEEALA